MAGWIEYRESITDENAEECPVTCIMRFYMDRNTWIDVTLSKDDGININSSSGLIIDPRASNDVDIRVRSR